MGSLLAELARREAATRKRIEEIREQIERLQENLTAEEQALSRLVVTRETVQEILGEAAGERPPVEVGAVDSVDGLEGAADVELALPTGRHSHGLARLAVTEAVRGSFDTAHAAITARCGKVIGKRQVEQLVTAAAVDVDAFYADRIPLPRTADELLVISVDSKGIMMRPDALREATAKAAARHKSTFRTRLASGENPAASAWPPWVWSTMPNPRHAARTM